MKAALIAVALGACVVDTAPPPSGDSSITVVNHSDFTIEELYVTASASASWGPNWLGSVPLDPGDTITLAVDCGTYDVELIDETAVICDLYGLDLCFDDATWVIENSTCASF
ncbi:MAG TPA: hypothetical protein VGG28_19240 [Kofleriaceae bacterium]